MPRYRQALLQELELLEHIIETSIFLVNISNLDKEYLYICSLYFLSFVD